jgi:hypothetical protein
LPSGVPRRNALPGQLRASPFTPEKMLGWNTGDVQKPMNNSLMEYAATEQSKSMQKTVLPPPQGAVL